MVWPNPLQSLSDTFTRLYEMLGEMRTANVTSILKRGNENSGTTDFIWGYSRADSKVTDL